MSGGGRPAHLSPGVNLAGRRSPARLSLETTLDERHLEHLGVHDRSVAEVAVLAEELAVVRGDDEVRAVRRLVHELAEERVDLGDGGDLRGLQAGERRIVERRARGALAAKRAVEARERR